MLLKTFLYCQHGCDIPTWSDAGIAWNKSIQKQFILEEKLNL